MDRRHATTEQAQYATIGIAVILAAVMVAGYAVSDLGPWALLALGAPISIILRAIVRIRRLHGHRPRR